MPNHKIHICMIAPAPPPYGGISHWTSMVSRYAEVRGDVQIFLLNTAPRWKAIHDTGWVKRSLGGGVQVIRDMWRLMVVLQRNRFDAIHLTTAGELAVVRDIGVTCLAASFGVPLVYHIRFGRVPVIASGDSWEWRALAWVMARSRAVIAIDAATGEAIRGHLPLVNLQVVPNCVDLSRLPSSADTEGLERTALFVGWVIPTKGIAELVEAWARVQPQGWRLLIVGPGDTAYQRELIRRFGAQGIAFLGELPHQQAMEQLAACDVFILPSHTEGFPNAVLEAMALGKAIVATCVGAIPEMLEGGGGLLVEPRDVFALAKAIEVVCASYETRSEMGRRAKERAVREYSIDAVFDRYISLWRADS